MQQLKTIEHKNEEQEVKRECKGRRLAITGKIYKLQNTNDDVFYVLSESRSDNTYYFVKYNLTDSYCSCPDSSMRQMKCKHIWSIEYAIRLATVKDIEKLPEEAIKYTNQQQLIEQDPAGSETQPSHHTTTEYSRLPTIIPTQHESRSKTLVKQVPTKSFNQEEYSF